MIVSALLVENILSPKSYKKFVRGCRGGPCQKLLKYDFLALLAENNLRLENTIKFM
jgi:hypothetical protein